MLPLDSFRVGWSVVAAVATAVEKWYAVPLDLTKHPPAAFPPVAQLRGAAVDEVMQEGFLDSYRNGMAAAAAAGSGVGVGPGAHAGAPDVITMVLQTCRDLGHFDEAAFVEIYKHVETVHVRAGEALFSVGDRDDSIFVVLRGEINLMVTGESGVQSRIAIKRTGDSITSLLSLLEMLGGNDSYFKTGPCPVSPCDCLP